MPKMKTHRGANKRFRKTGKGKFKYKASHNRHNQMHQSSFNLREKRKIQYVADADMDQVKRLLPYG